VRALPRATLARDQGCQVCSLAAPEAATMPSPKQLHQHTSRFDPETIAAQSSGSQPPSPGSKDPDKPLSPLDNAKASSPLRPNSPRRHSPLNLRHAVAAEREKEAITSMLRPKSEEDELAAMMPPPTPRTAARLKLEHSIGSDGKVSLNF